MNTPTALFSSLKFLVSLSFLTFATGCKTRAFNQNKASALKSATGAAIVPSKDTPLAPVAAGDAWTPHVVLRDKVTVPQSTTQQLPEPGGWYVAPIHAVMRADGNLMGAEEEFGLLYARVYNSATQTFASIDFPMFETSGGKAGTAWYPTTTKLHDGRVLVTGGYFRCCQGDNRNNSIAVFDPAVWKQGKNPWKNLVKHENGADEMGPGLRDYSHNFLLPKPLFLNGHNRQVIGRGWRGKFFLISTDPGVPEKERIVEHPQGKRPPGDTHAWNATAVMLDNGEIVTFGGTHNGPTASRVDFFNPYTGQWRTVDGGISRNNASSLLLPDGTVLLMSGETEGSSNFAGSRRQPQIFDPRPGRNLVTTFAPWTDETNATGEDLWERGYHNFSLLLKDGRVLVGGGLSKLGQVGCERPDLRIRSPARCIKGPG